MKNGSVIAAFAVVEHGSDSKGDARRQLKQGGIYIHGERAGLEATVAGYHLLAGRYIWLRRGKKKDVIVKVTE